ncbi:tRNA threonylcarbamoyladenosine biosynthesis protein TsaB [Candidatus Profftia lariciata]|uniref:tRNA (adenosine(37)-N6)-threonylcarbamoyltransferase complex dimerization subunit type 1 TsaB n=1 Tax=Candidatus Profftia lariciata TaxID=1987921 RepID=UPI001D020774|nr:tRNA (adenosine(37)-N6)-threonylcarbamoyltransferase complex dimerization subunit type 1 TsaB [Candidatus Profftia lariciata]UDG81670.1 tRNA threonylcarbamoyladenosine biosynthesis protein TsaB [Candidatus Profftia lariciata]
MSLRLLAIDTATEACSVAVWNNGKKYTLFTACPRKHTHYILPMVQQILLESGISLKQLSALIFSRGPGSFTGVRIGIGIAQGLAMGAELPMIGISSLATMAQGAFRLTGATQVLIAIDAHMGEIYWGQYKRDHNGAWIGENTESILKPECVQHHIVSLVGEWAIAGTGWIKYPNIAEMLRVKLIGIPFLVPQAEDMLPLALIDFFLGKCISVENAKPNYLRHAVVLRK